MLLNLHKKKWEDGFHLQDFEQHEKENIKTIKVSFSSGNYIVAQTSLQEMLDLAKNYNKAIQEEEKMTKEKLAIAHVGKIDPKRHLQKVRNVLDS